MRSSEQLNWPPLISSELADLVLLVLLRSAAAADLGEPVLQLAPPLLLDRRLSDRVEPQQADKEDVDTKLVLGPKLIFSICLGNLLLL